MEKIKEKMKNTYSKKGEEEKKMQTKKTKKETITFMAEAFLSSRPPPLIPLNI